MIATLRHQRGGAALALFFLAGLGALLGACSSGSAGSGSGQAAAATANVAGGKCLVSGESVCVGEQGVLECRAGTWVPFACRGKDGCKDGSVPRATCDDSSSTPGDPCLHDKAAACAFDGSAQLVCTGGKWVAAAKCTGSHGCSVSGSYIMCDGGIAVEKEPCAMSSTRENVACTADGKTTLRCADNAWTAKQTCLGPQGCKVEMGNQFCDTSIVKEGDACKIQRTSACSTDLKSLLECDGTAFHKKKTCPKGCLPHAMVSTCE